MTFPSQELVRIRWGLSLCRLFGFKQTAQLPGVLLPLQANADKLVASVVSKAREAVDILVVCLLLFSFMLH